MAAGQWEVVGKKNKGDGGKKTSKQQKKKYVDNMPKLDESVPIKESQTMFDALWEKENKKAQQPHSKSNGTIEAVKTNAQPKKKTQEKKKSQPPPKPPSIEEAIQELNVEEMQTLLATVEARFPDSPMIWLKDLASYMNVKLDIDVPDPVFSNKPVGYPASLLSSLLRELLINALKRCTTQTLQLFFEHCLLTMIQDMVKGLHTIGYRIFLQCLAQEMPAIATENIPKCVDFRNSYQNRQNVCLTILWASGQAGNKNLEAGFKVWLEVMFPILGTRAYSKYTIDYLEQLLSSCATSPVTSIIGVRELFPILDFIYSSSGLAANLQKQLQDLYPKLKSLSYGSNPSTVLRNYFPSYLRRLEPNCSALLKNEILLSLVECLAADKQSYSVWRQLYTKHLIQSSILISHLLKEWDNLPSSFPRKLLFETLSAFQVTNEELKGQGKANRDVEDSVVSCKALLTKMSSQRLPVGKILFFTTIIVIALLSYDVQLHGSFKNSKTGQLMKDVGLLAICEQAWGKITVYTGKAFKWLDVNVPVFHAWLCRTCGPYLQLFWEKLITLSVYIWHSTEGIRSWFNTNIPPFLQYVSDNLPLYVRKFTKSTEGVALFVLNHSLSVLKYMEYYISIVIAWLHANIFTGSMSVENLQRYAGNTVQAFQQYSLSTYNLISNYIATVIYPGK